MNMKQCWIHNADGAQRIKLDMLDEMLAEGYALGRTKRYSHHCEQCKNSFDSKKIKQRFCSRQCTRQSSWHNPEIGRKGGQASAKIQRTIRRSKNEMYFAELCKNRFDDVLENERMFEGWDADVILPALKVAVLWNGKWHYEKIGNHSLLQVQTRDKLKLQAISRCGYEAYIIKDMGKHDVAFVSREFEKFLLRDRGVWSSSLVS